MQWNSELPWSVYHCLATSQLKRKVHKVLRSRPSYDLGSIWNSGHLSSFLSVLSLEGPGSSACANSCISVAEPAEFHPLMTTLHNATEMHSTRYPRTKAQTCPEGAGDLYWGWEHLAAMLVAPFQPSGVRETVRWLQLKKHTCHGWLIWEGGRAGSWKLLEMCWSESWEQWNV